MVLKALTSHITTGNSVSYWGKVFSENGLFILLQSKEFENKPAAVSGSLILDSILTAFTNFTTHDISTVAQLLSEMEGKKEIETLVIAIQKEEHLFLGSLGNGEVLLIRDEKLGTILQKSEVSQGKLEPNDTLIFYPDVFRTLYSDLEIPILASPFSSVSLSDRVNADLVSHPDVAGLTLLVAHFSKVSFSGNKKIFSFSGWTGKIKSFPQTALSSVRKILKKESDSPSESFTPDAKEIKSKRILFLISCTLVLLLLASIFFNMNRTRDIKKQRELSDTLVLISHQYDESASLIDINPIRARSLLIESKSTLSPLLSAFSKKSPEYKQIQDWLLKISQKEVEAYKIFKLTAVPVFFDVTFLKASAQASKISGYKNIKAILDVQNRVVYTLNTDTKESAIVAGSDIVKDARSVAIHGSDVFILNSDGVVHIDIKSKTAKTVIKKDDSWGEAVALASYGGNIYILDRTKNAIWKYIATDAGFSDKTAYMNSGVRVNFSAAQDLTIDGSVWVLFSDGIAKYAHGVNDQFVISGFSDTLSGLSAFSTDESDKYMYLLDQTLSRIVVFDKDGLYQSQYQWDDLKNATDFLANEDTKKIFVTIGSKIYAIDIK